MAKDMKDIIARSGDRIVGDLVGVIALAALLVGSLYLPALL